MAYHRRFPHPAGTGSPWHCVTAACAGELAADGPESAVCRTCGLVYRIDGAEPVLDATATRAALFSAAAACSGPTWSIQSLAFGPGPGLRRGPGLGLDDSGKTCWDRLGLAEDGLATLAALTR
jgi:hypothetical protein